MYYTTAPQKRVKREIKTVTRTFDENENLVEEREETDIEYEYVGGYTYPQPTSPTYPYIFTNNT